MSFFVDRLNRRKSPIALAAFGAAILYLFIFGVLYALLAEPLHRGVALGSAQATLAAHALIIAVLGTAVCCGLFALKDKRVAPYGFLGLAAILGMFCAAAFLLEGYARSNMLYLIMVYGLAPVLVGNAVTWPIYLRIKRAHPGMNRRKTIAEELREAVAKETAKRPPSPEPERAPQSRKAPEPAPSAGETAPTAEEALFGPQADRAPDLSRSVQEEAMLFYEEYDDEEAGDD